MHRYNRIAGPIIDKHRKTSLAIIKLRVKLHMVSIGVPFDFVVKIYNNSETVTLSIP